MIIDLFSTQHRKMTRFLIIACTVLFVPFILALLYKIISLGSLPLSFSELLVPRLKMGLLVLILSLGLIGGWRTYLKSDYFKTYTFVGSALLLKFVLNFIPFF